MRMVALHALAGRKLINAVISGVLKPHVTLGDTAGRREVSERAIHL